MASPRRHREVTASVLGAIALVAVLVWGVAKLVNGDWFIGSAFVACAVLGLRSLVLTVRRLRRAQ